MSVVSKLKYEDYEDSDEENVKILYILVGLQCGALMKVNIRNMKLFGIIFVF